MNGTVLLSLIGLGVGAAAAYLRFARRFREPVDEQTHGRREGAHEWASRVTSAAIRNQEVQGQNDLVSSTMLPVSIKGAPGGRGDFERMGIVFEDAIRDDLFVQVTLPPGWKKIPTDDSRLSSLVDDRGRKRASIFYKAGARQHCTGRTLAELRSRVQEARPRRL